MNPRILHLYEPTPESPFLSARAATNHWLPGALRELDLEVVARPIAGTPVDEISELSAHFDVVHVLGHLPENIELRAPAVQTVFDDRPFGLAPLPLSWRQAESLRERPVAVVPPGVAVDEIDLPFERGDHLVTVFDPARPAAMDEAIRVAHAVERELVILVNAGETPTVESHLARVEVLEADRQPASLVTAAAYLALHDRSGDLAAVTALAAGVPVITLEGTATAETLVAGESGYVCRDIDDVIRAIGRLDLLSRRHGMDRARMLFDVRAWAMRMAEAYRSVATGQRPRFAHPEHVAAR